MLALHENLAKTYTRSMEVALLPVVEKVHKELLKDKEIMKKLVDEKVNAEVDKTRRELDNHYKELFRAEADKLAEKHSREIAEIKGKQWCWYCGSEALYLCCWNTNYCGVECQQNDWLTHRHFCRRDATEEETS